MSKLKRESVLIRKKKKVIIFPEVKRHRRILFLFLHLLPIKWGVSCPSMFKMMMKDGYSGK